MPALPKPLFRGSLTMKQSLGGIFIAAGSNLGDREAHIVGGFRDLAENGDVRILRCSTLREYAAVGGPAGQPAFLNAAAEIATELRPRELLKRMHLIETRHGRKRDVRNGPRTLDLDLLLFGDERIDEPGLIVPHPRMLEREFVLEPLCEIGGEAILELARRVARDQ